MLFLIADVFYHPFQIFRAETNDTITSLPIQELAIYEFMVDMMRTRAFDLSDPLADCQRRRDGYGDMNVRLDTANFVEDQTARLQSIGADKAMETSLDPLVYDWQIDFRMPNEMEIDLGVGPRRHGSKPAEAGCGVMAAWDPAVKRLG